MNAFIAWLSARNKALMSLAVGVYGWGLFVVNSPANAITANEWMLLASVGLGALGVHQIPNLPVPPTPPPAEGV